MENEKFITVIVPDPKDEIHTGMVLSTCAITSTGIRHNHEDGTIDVFYGKNRKEVLAKIKDLRLKVVK